MLLRKKLLFYFHKYFRKIFFFYLIYFILLSFLIIVFNGISTPLNGNLIFDNFWKETKGYDFYLNLSQLEKNPPVQDLVKNEIDKIVNSFSEKDQLYFQWDKKIVPFSTKWNIINDHNEKFLVNEKNFSFITFPETPEEANKWNFNYFYYKKNIKPKSSDGNVYSVYISSAFAKNYHLKLNSMFELNYDVLDPTALIKIKVSSIDYTPRRVYNRESIFEGMNSNFIFLLDKDLKALQKKTTLNYYYNLYFRYQNENISKQKKNLIFSQLNNKFLQDERLKAISLVKKFDFNDMNTFYFKNYSISVYYVVILFILMLSIFLFSIFFICLESYLSKLSVSLAILKVNGYKKSEIIRPLMAYFSFWFFFTFLIAYLVSFFTTKYFLMIYLSPFILPYNGYYLNNYVVLAAFILIYGTYLIFIILIALKKLSKNSLATINNISDLLILKTQKWKKFFSKLSFFIKSVINLFVSYFKNSLFFFSGIFITTFLILSSFVFNFSIFSLSDRYETVNNFNSQYVLSKPFFYDNNHKESDPDSFFSKNLNLKIPENAKDFLNKLEKHEKFSINFDSMKKINRNELIDLLKKDPNYKFLIDYIKKVYEKNNFTMSFNEYYLDQSSNDSLSFLLSYVSAESKGHSTNFQVLSIPSEIDDKLTNCFPLLTKNVIDELKNFSDPNVIPLIGNSYFHKNYSDFYNQIFTINGKNFKVIDYLENDFSFFPCVYGYFPELEKLGKNFSFDGNYVFYKNNIDYQSFFNIGNKYQSIIFLKTSNQEIKNFINQQFKIFIAIFWILIILSSLISIVFTFIFMEYLLRKNRMFFVVFKATGYKNSFTNFVFLTVYALSAIIGLIFAVIASYYILGQLYTIATNKIILPIFFVFKIIWVAYTIGIMLIIILLSYITAKKKLKLEKLSSLLKTKE